VVFGGSAFLVGLTASLDSVLEVVLRLGFWGCHFLSPLRAENSIIPPTSPFAITMKWRLPAIKMSIKLSGSDTHKTIKQVKRTG